MKEINVIIYTNEGCPRCEVLKQKLDAKGIHYIEKQDFDKAELAKHGFSMMPVLEYDGMQMDLAFANKWINEV